MIQLFIYSGAVLNKILKIPLKFILKLNKIMTITVIWSSNKYNLEKQECTAECLRTKDVLHMNGKRGDTCKKYCKQSTEERWKATEDQSKEQVKSRGWSILGSTPEDFQVTACVRWCEYDEGWRWSNKAASLLLSAGVIPTEWRLRPWEVLRLRPSDVHTTSNASIQ